MSKGILRPIRLAAIPVLLLLLASGIPAQGANPPEGSHTFKFHPEVLADLNGPMNIGLPYFVEELPFDLTMDGKGNIYGAGSMDNVLDTEGGLIPVSMDYTLKGKLKLTNGFGKITMKLKITGVSGGDDIPLTGSANFNGEVDLFENTSSMTVDFKACGKGKGCVKEREYSTGTVPAALVALWRLDLEITRPTEKSLAGTARVELSTGTIFDFTLKGKYDPKKDESTIQLKSPAGCSIKITHFKADPISGDTAIFNYSIAGQKGSIIFD